MRAWLAVLLIAGCVHAAEPKIEVVGDLAISARVLKAAARRDLAAYAHEPHAGALYDAAWDMEADLRRRGHPDARVSFTAEPDADAARRVRFQVEAGPKATIAEVGFPGLSPKESERAARFFTGRRGLFDRGHPPYVEGEVDGALRKVEQFYLLDGFYRVRARIAATTFSADRTQVRLTVAVERGPRYHVRSATLALDGDEPPPDGFAGAAHDALAQLDGKPFRVRMGEEAAARLRGWLRDHGRLHAEVTATQAIDDGAASTAIVLHVDPAREVRLRRVEIVRGTGRTQEGFVREVLHLDDGQPWDQSRIDSAVRDLYRSGVFTRVEADAVDVPDDPGAADLRVRITEVARPSNLDFLLGWGSYEQLRGGVRYHDRNFPSGWGRNLELGAEASLRTWGGDITYRDDYSLGVGNSLRVTPYYEFRQEPSYDRRELGAVTAVTHRFGDTLEGTVGHHYRVTRASDIREDIPADESDDFFRVSELYTQAGWDRRDSRVNPTDGWVLDGRFGISVPQLGADIAFLSYQASARGFVPLSRTITLGLGLRYATIDIIDGHETLPITERLFLGGDADVRSFAYHEFGPAGSDGHPLGGLTTLVATIEPRFRIWRSLQGAVFYDVGEIGEQAGRPDSPPGQAIGGGLRYLLPIGPIRIDAGWNPGERFAARRPWAIHVSVGFSF